MRQGLLFLLVIVIVTLLFFMVRSIVSQLDEKELSNSNGPIPPLKFLRIDGAPMTGEEILADAPVMIKYLNPDCDICHEEISKLLGAYDAFKGMTTLLVVAGDEADIEGFSREYSLEQYPGLLVVREGERSFADHFGESVFPTTLIYGPDHSLIDKIEGQVNLSYITKLISN